MKLPSVKNILNIAGKTAQRFPFMLLSMLIGTAATICAIDPSLNTLDYNVEEWFMKIFFFCALAFVYFISSVLYGESRKNKITSILLQISCLLLVVLYYFFTPELDDFSVKDGSTLGLLIFAGLLSISFAFVISKRKVHQAFWQFNRKVISRFFVSLLYSGSLFGGLALAMLAVHYLFQIEIDEERYGQLFFLIFCLFGTWHWAAGIPNQLEELEHDKTYPKGLSVFTKYILLPLVYLYLIILYAYTIRILILWELPQGWVSYLVLTLAGIGIIACLFVWPLNDAHTKSWIKSYSRYFFYALLPLLALLYTGILRRISDYGITPNRYIVLILACWLLAISLYFLLSKKKDIRILPVSLSILTIAVIIGPWSMYSVSTESQIKRLEKMMKENGLWVDGAVDTTHVQISDSIGVEINKILSELEDINGDVAVLNKRWNLQLDSQTVSELSWDDVSRRLNIPTQSTYHSDYSDLPDFNYWVNDNDGIVVSGYDYYYSSGYVHYSRENSNDQEDSIVWENDNYSLCVVLADQGKTLTFKEDGKQVAVMYLSDYFNQLKERQISVIEHESRSVTDSELDFNIETPTVHLKFHVTNLEGYIDKNNIPRLQQMNMNMLVKLKKK